MLPHGLGDEVLVVRSVHVQDGFGEHHRLPDNRGVRTLYAVRILPSIRAVGPEGRLVISKHDVAS